MNILFVCTGNTCRSPMAEALFNDVCRRRGIDHFSFSRGTNVFYPEPVNPKAVAALKAIGTDIPAKMSAAVSEEDMIKADIILTMTSAHKMALKSMFPKYSEKIFTLNEKAYGKDKPVSDPFGGTENVYLQCAKELKNAVEALADKL